MKSLKNPEILLASASPRRYELLTQLGFQVLVKPVDIDESRCSDESPAAYCQRLAIEKNQAAVKRFAGQQPVAIVTADTIVAVGDKTLGKPRNSEQVMATLKQLSGGRHLVLTAVCVSYGDQFETCLQTSEVTFAELDAGWLRSYAATDEPLDKAGGYGIQGAAGRWISAINGSYTGIMGLPLYETSQLLTKLDIMTVTDV